MAAKLGVELHEYQSMLEEVSPVFFLSLNDTVYEDGDQAIRLEDVIKDAESFGPYETILKLVAKISCRKYSSRWVGFWH